MPRRTVLTASERQSLFALPHDALSRAHFYTFDEPDKERIRVKRGEANRLGFGVLLCYFRYPGFLLSTDETPPTWLLKSVARQIGVSPDCWDEYSHRGATRREHALELQQAYGFTSFTREHVAPLLEALAPLAATTDRGLVIASTLTTYLRERGILLPTPARVEELSAMAITAGWRQTYRQLGTSLREEQKVRLESWLQKGQGAQTTIETTEASPEDEATSQPSMAPLRWLLQPLGFPGARSIRAHIERLKAIEDVGLWSGVKALESTARATLPPVSSARRRQLARQGATMNTAELQKLEPARRLATLVALAVERRASLLDEILEGHDRMVALAWNKAKRLQQEHSLQQHASLKTQVRLYAQIGQKLVAAREQNTNAFGAIESVLEWEEFVQSVQQATDVLQGRMGQSDPLIYLGDSYLSIHRYASAFLENLKFCAAHTSHTRSSGAQSLLEAAQTLKAMHTRGARKVPADAPTGWISPRWRRVIEEDTGGTHTAKEGRVLNRKFYELGVMSELKNALRSGDIWVEGSRQFGRFEEYLLSPEQAKALLKPHSAQAQSSGAQPASSVLSVAPLPIDTDGPRFLQTRLALLKKELQAFEKAAKAGRLPEARFENQEIKVAPLKEMTPPETHECAARLNALLPRVKITELLLEVERWTGLSGCFTHLKSGTQPKEIELLLTALLADGLNLGLSKMASAAPELSYGRLSWFYSWHIRDQTYEAALALLVSAQSKEPLSTSWGTGATSSSDGQRFRAAAHGAASGQWNPKYGSEPGRLFYTHLSDQFAPFASHVINTTVRDATYVLDGLLHHGCDLHIEEHYTDTAGFTDHVFALMHLLGFKFAPRIRDLADKRLYLPPGYTPGLLTPLCGATLNTSLILSQWDELLRLALSIQQGVASASLLLRKLGAYPRQHSLATALRELGRLERTLFTLQWWQNLELRRRVQIGLNKGEARNALARAVFFHRLGEVRDRSFENQKHRASGLTLLTAAIILWNTRYLSRALEALQDRGHVIKTDLLPHISPLTWEHINLTGDYSWNTSSLPKPGHFRPLRNPHL